MSGTIAITMAGLGSRFSKAGYDRPKYEIEALGRPLFDWSILSLSAFAKAGWRFSFATRAGLGAIPYIEERASALGIEVDTIIELDDVTDGQATTALILAKVATRPLSPFAIYNIDTFVTPGAMVPPGADALSGWIPCFPAPGDMWSFARENETGQIMETREKVRISEDATVGLYWFASAHEYADIYASHFANGQGAEKGERYVAPMYNTAIAQGGRVTLSRLALEDVGMLGTPEQVAAFIANPPPSLQKTALT